MKKRRDETKQDRKKRIESMELMAKAIVLVKESGDTNLAFRMRVFADSLRIW